MSAGLNQVGSQNFQPKFCFGKSAAAVKLEEILAGLDDGLKLRASVSNSLAWHARGVLLILDVILDEEPTMAEPFLISWHDRSLNLLKTKRMPENVRTFTKNLMTARFRDALEEIKEELKKVHRRKLLQGAGR